MSATHDRGEPVRRTDEELLHWLLDPRTRERFPRARIEARPGAAARLAELEELLDSCRRSGAQLDELAPARHRALVARALASTTRAQPKWSGRSRRFVVPRWLRVAAATLLVALIAWPVAKWYRGAVASEAIVLDGAPAPEAPIDAAPGAGDPLGVELDMREWDPERFVAMSLSWARHRLGDGAPVLAGAESGGAGTLRALRERRRALGASERGTAVELAKPAAGAPLLERTLWCELLLDRHAAKPGSAPELDEALAALGSERLPADDAGLFAAAALARAESLGVLPASAAGTLARARRDLGHRGGAEALIEPAEDVRRVASLDGAWRAALVAAAPGPLPSGMVRALEDWSPR